MPTETRRGLKCTSCKCYVDNICRNVDSYHYGEEGNLDICKYIQVDRTHDDDDNENICEF